MNSTGRNADKDHMEIQSLRVGLATLAILCASVLLFSACSGDAGPTGDAASVNDAPQAIAGPGGSSLVIPPGAVATSTPITLSAVSDLELPAGRSALSTAIRATPAGLHFERAGVLALPLRASVADNQALRDRAEVWARSEDGSVSRMPVLGVDEERGVIYAAVKHFTVFQAAVPIDVFGPFAIVPRTSPLVFVNEPMSLGLTHGNNVGAVTYALDTSVQIEGDEATIEPAEGVVEALPGVTLHPTGVLSGIPNTLGTWALTITASDAGQVPAATSTISLTVTVLERETTTVPGLTTDTDHFVQRDDYGNIHVMRRSGSAYTLHRVPADPLGTTLTTTFTGGPAPAFAVSPDGERVVVAFERMAGRSLLFTRNQLRSAIDTGDDSSADDIGFDLTGNGVADVTVTFATEATAFEATDADIQALVDALNAEFANLSLGLSASAYLIHDGISIFDEGTNTIPAAFELFDPRLVAGGDVSFTIFGVIDEGNSPHNTRIVVREFDATLTALGGEVRVDADPSAVLPEDAIDRRSRFQRQALRPSVAFALDRSFEPTDVPDPDTVYLYCVGYEVLSDLDATGALRSDAYANWRLHGVGAVGSFPIRLDVSDDAGASSGATMRSAGQDAGVSFFWIEKGNDNDGTNPTDDEGNATPGSRGDLAMVQLTPPDPDNPPTEPEVAPEPVFLNNEADTSALHLNVCVSSDNRIFCAWSEFDDDATTISEPTPPHVPGSVLDFRRDTSLRCAEVTGAGGAGVSWLVDDAPLTSTIVRPSVAVSADGEVAVGWVEIFDGGVLDGYLRRFSAPGTPISNVQEIAWQVEFNLHYDDEGRLGIASTGGSPLRYLRFRTPDAE